MIELYYKPSDPRYIYLAHDSQKTTMKVLGSDHKYKEKEVYEIQALEAHLNQIPQYMYLPSFAGIKKPVCFLEKYKIGERVIYYCMRGLWNEIMEWCRSKGISCGGVYMLSDYGKDDKQPDKSFVEIEFNESFEEFKEYVNNWNLNLELRDYQYEAIWKILHYKQSMSQLATRSGKTLMAYVIFRWMLEHGAHNILMVVPSITLVKQGVQDMKDYKEFFGTEAVWAKGEYCEGANLTIGTFQSLVKRCVKGRTINKHYNPKFFDKFDVICIDECHKADCESIKQIMSQPFVRDAKMIFGFSGTLPERDTLESYGCQTLLGPCIQDISTMDLVGENYLAKPIITQIRLKYDEDLDDKYIRYAEYLCSNYKTSGGKKVLLPKEMRDMNMIHEKVLPIAVKQWKENVEIGLLSEDAYRENLIDMCKAQGSNLLVLEQMIAEHSEKKLGVICQIIEQWDDKNGIVFAHNEPYIDFLEKYMKERFPDRKIYKIKGATSVKKRTEIIDNMNKNDHNAILIASFGTVSTGITFKNIDYAVFAQSFKSQIIVLQSLGRGLIRTDDKDEFYLYDIIDVLPTGRLKKQGESKIKLYKEKGFDYKIVHR